MGFLKVSLFVGLAAFAVSCISTLIARKLGKIAGIVDQPDGFRKIHKRPIPLTGGYAIIVAFLVPIAVMYFGGSAHIQSLFGTERERFSMLIAGALISLAMGATDDVYNLRPRWKLIFQFVAALFAYFGGFAINAVSLPGGGVHGLGYFSLPITVFWFLGCMNAINLLDGLDGLAGGIGLFACATLAAVSLLMGHPFCMFLAICMSGAILGFLIFNFNPASIFLGDGGSMLIGFMVAALSLVGSYKAETAVALLIPFIALGLPVFDTALAMLRRWARRVPMSAADKKHIHHVLIALGLSQRKVVLLLYAVCLMLGGVSLLITAGRNQIAAVLMGGIGILAVVCVRGLGMVNFDEIKDRIKSDLNDRRKGNAASAEVEKAVQSLPKAKSIDGVWDYICPAFQSLDLDHAFFDMGDDVGTSKRLFWRREGAIQTETLVMIHSGREVPMDKWSIFLNVHFEGKSYGTLEVWKKGEEMPIRDATMLINKLRRGLGEHTHRVVQEQPERPPMIIPRVVVRTIPSPHSTKPELSDALSG